MNERITPIAGPSPPTDPPDALAVGTVLELPLKFGFDVELVVENAAVSGRPYFWTSDENLTNGGAWIALRGDAVAGVGTAPITATPGSYGGTAHGTFTHRAGRARLIFVTESGLIANVKRCALIPIQRDYT
mgnify:CR=1 FL=1